jgi:hypothetical protein
MYVTRGLLDSSEATRATDIGEHAEPVMRNPSKRRVIFHAAWQNIRKS